VTPCPDDQTLAAFVDGQLAESGRDQTIAHLDACATCFERVATIAAAASTTAIAPAALVERVTSSSPRPPWRAWVPAGAVAAGLLLAVTVWRSAPPVTPPAEPASAEPAVRSRGATVHAPVLEEPRDDERQQPGFRARWQVPEGAVFSEVKLTTPGGDVLWSTEVQGTTSQVNVPVVPPGDGIAYLWVTTHLPEGRKVSSNVIRVRGAPRP
jgi:anti-sigma factor RsiW